MSTNEVILNVILFRIYNQKMLNTEDKFTTIQPGPLLSQTRKMTQKSQWTYLKLDNLYLEWAHAQMASQGLCHHGDSLCSSDFTAENVLCLPTYSNTSETARYFKINHLYFILQVLSEQNANDVNPIIFCTKCFLLRAKSSVGNMEMCPKYLKGSWPLLFLDLKHLHFSKAGPFHKSCLEVIYILLTYYGLENLEMSSFSLRPSWICEPSY